jgi:hypothetical protein
MAPELACLKKQTQNILQLNPSAQLNDSWSFLADGPFMPLL